MLIVGALIALFSGLAIFGVQQQFRNNTRKAAIGESRQIATALDFANLDTSVFPKLCWLQDSTEGVLYQGGLINSADPTLPFIFADIGSRLSPAPQRRAFGGNIQLNWKGPYFALSQGRAGVAQGRGGFVYMLIPELQGGDATNPNNIDSSNGLRWPADPYNNPWVVYMMDVDRSTPTRPFLKFVNDAEDPTNINRVDPTRKGNFVNAVVSYGNNHYPGGGEDVRATYGAVGGGDAAAVVSDGQGPYSLRLYKGLVGYKASAKGYVTHTYLGNAEYTRDRANIWNREFAINNIGFFPGGLGSLPTDGKGNGINSVLGITDSGSDDIVFEF